MGKSVSKHRQHKRGVVNDAPYEPAAVRADEDAPDERQENPVEGQQDNPVHPEEVNWEVLDEVPSASTDDHGDYENPPEAASDEVSDSQIEPNIHGNLYFWPTPLVYMLSV